MDTGDMLAVLREKALADPELRQQLLATKHEKEPLVAFCKLALKAGLELTLMDLVEYGEDAYAAMCRSTNGGGENSPNIGDMDDAYENFLAGLRKNDQD